MNVSNLEWVMALLAVSAFFFLIPKLWLRQALLFVCNAAFLVSQSSEWISCCIIGLFIIVGYGSAKLLLSGSRRAILVSYLVLIIAAFIYIKQYSIAVQMLPSEFFAGKIAVVGLSYMFFRQIHLVVDAYQGQICNLTFWNYINYQLNLFGLLAGPIQRYQDFVESWRELLPIYKTERELLMSYRRIFLGVVKVLGLGALLLSLYHKVTGQFLSGPDSIRTATLFVVSIYLFVGFLYFNFSGYCDIVIAGAGLVGLKLPENFMLPFIARNISDLWTRWHRTLGFFIRDYLFTPLFKGCMERWPGHAASASIFALLVAFCLAGLWHGSTWNFMIFGLLHGFAVVCAKLWEMFLVRRIGRQGLKAYLQNRWIRVVAVILTFNYFAFTLLFWYNSLDQCEVILKKLLASLKF
jgi:D-alanyl-lipoteichoic acid acyltransferase DltB (MBOAT superfamily)